MLTGHNASWTKAIAAVLMLLMLSSSLPADQLKKDTSLQFVPDSAGFYFSILRLKAQWDCVADSRALAKLQELPVMQMAMGVAKQKWDSADGPAEVIRDFASDPENADLMAVLCDAVSNEVFMFADEELGRAVFEMNRLNRQNSQSQIKMLQQDDLDEDKAKEQMIGAVIEAVKECDVPGIVMGFRVTDAEMAATQLQRLQEMAQAALADVSELEGRLAEESYGDSKFMQLTLDSEMIPWDEAAEEGKLTEEQAESIAEALQGKELVVSVGMFNDYVLLVVGGQKNPLTLLDNGTLLIDREEFTRLRSKDGEDFTSIGYAAGEFMQQVSRPKEEIEHAAQMVSALLGRAGLEEEMLEQIRADIDGLSKDIQSVIPQTRTILGFEYLTVGGIDGYVQNWSENLFLDGSQKLDILDHVGGNPILVWAMRRARSSDKTADFSKWIGRAAYYAEQLAMRQDVDEEDAELYAKFRDGLMPFAKRFGQVTTNHFAPAMRDGQMAVVVDSTFPSRTPKEWHPMMPESEEQLEVLEMAEIYGVDDVEQLETAFEQYAAVASEALEELKTLVRDNQQAIMERLEGPQAQMLPILIQGAQLPQPQTKDSDNGEVRYFGMLQQLLGLDPSLAPAMAWSPEVLVMSNSPDTADRILEKTPLDGPLAKSTDRELAAATHVDVAKLIGTIKPWVSYGLQIAAEQQDNPMIEAISPQVETILDIAQCFRRYTSVTFEEDGSLVVFYQQRFEDLQE